MSTERTSVLSPKPAINTNFTAEDLSLLASIGASTAEYAAVLMPTVAQGVGFTEIPGAGRAVMLQVVAVIPPDLLPPDASLLIDPQTNQPRLSERLAKAFPEGYPMVVRALVKRTALGEATQKRLAAYEERQALLNTASAPKGGSDA